jgi:uncharacterized protein Yka (UPF0111/DUF47 family)
MALTDVFKRVRSWRLLPPADKEFYALFKEATDTLVEASKLLISLFETSSQDSRETEVKISTCALRLDQVGDSIEKLLDVAQQPPFDRGDISGFKDDAIKIIKFISHAANRYVIYDFPSSDKEMRELAPLINEACEEIAKAVRSLSRDRNVDPYYKAVGRLEEKADEIYHEGLRRRVSEIRQDRAGLMERIREFSEGGDGSGIIPRKELLSIIASNVEYTRHTAIFFVLRQVYAELERAIDACKEATATLKRMVTKNV